MEEEEEIRIFRAIAWLTSPTRAMQKSPVLQAPLPATPAWVPSPSSRREEEEEGEGEGGEGEGEEEERRRRRRRKRRREGEREEEKKIKNKKIEDFFK